MVTEEEELGHFYCLFLITALMTYVQIGTLNYEDENIVPDQVRTLSQVGTSSYMAYAK